MAGAVTAGGLLMFSVEEAGCRGEEERDEAHDSGDDAKCARVCCRCAHFFDLLI
jgi:hypothetical protein